MKSGDVCLDTGLSLLKSDLTQSASSTECSQSNSTHLPTVGGTSDGDLLGPGTGFDGAVDDVGVTVDTKITNLK